MADVVVGRQLLRVSMNPISNDDENGTVGGVGIVVKNERLDERLNDGVSGLATGFVVVVTPMVPVMVIVTVT